MEDTPPHVSLARSAIPLDAEITAGRLPPVAAAGVLLTKIVLAMVMACVVLLAAYLISADFTEGAALTQATSSLLKQPGGSAEQLHQLSEIIHQLADQRAAFRAFWLQMTQLILLNLLLPLLTALLGYIFGTTRARSEE